MRKHSLLIVFCVLLITAFAGAPPCPIQATVGSVLSGRVVIGKQQSLIPLTDNIDIQCYNYTLPYNFGEVPDVAIAIHDFEVRTTHDLFFSVKVLETDNAGVLPFLVRTPWRYTYWTKIIFSFFAETRPEFQAGYYEIDSGRLGGCEAGKDIKVLMPFRKLGLQMGKINHLLFLQGFEITTQNYDHSTYSPFEVQIVESVTNSSGIAVLLSVTTITQVHNIYISYLAWTETELELAYGTYFFEKGVKSNDPYSRNELVHSPISNIGRNYARIHGITGFIFNDQQQGLKFTTTWTGTKFLFSTGADYEHVLYLTFNYIFFQGHECSSCPGFNFYYQEKCRSSCPVGTFPTKDSSCIDCGNNYYFDGESCVKLCPEGQVLDKINNECICPAGTQWTGIICISCTQGRIFNNITKNCECSSDTKWNGFTCAKIDRCTNGKQWNVFTFECQCPIGSIWNGTYCNRKIICSGGQIATSNNECACPDGMFLNNGYCQPTGCTGGQIFQNGRCECEKGFNWNGKQCLLCINGQEWNQNSKSCLCPSNQRWNGNFCEKFTTCTGGRVYFKDLDKCLCKQGSYWNGAQCEVRPECCCGQKWNEITFECDCPSNFNWDGHKCVLCTNGKQWDKVSKSCVCPAGTQWNNQFCAIIQNCFGGMIWNQNTWACECPSTTVFNGNYCIANYCQGGQVWDQSLKNCICVGGKIFVNGFCISPDTTCTYGRVWNNLKRKCECPLNKFDTGSSCQNVTTCHGNQLYNPYNNKCECPHNLVWLAAKNVCGDPTCPINERWDGYGCVKISCPPGSFYNGTQCICITGNDNKKCLPWEIYDGEKCIYYQDTCPLGSRWDGKECKPTNNCPIGFYGENNVCKPFPQRCIPPTIWGNNKCEVKGNNCPFGTYFNSGSCYPQASCQNGQQWDSELFQCLCPEGTGWNGQQCVQCAGNQIWQPLEGCKCPAGHFNVGSKCQKPDKTRCRNIPNAFWSNANGYCECEPGFTVQGYQCICKGVPFDHFCDRCAHKPNSEWKFGLCQCKTGYAEYRGECLPNLNGTDVPADCGVGTYFDTQQKKCLACPDGCLSCKDCYTCSSCDIKFRLDPVTQLCEQNCGDGKRFILECDDGNNKDGDGCSVDCKVEPGYTCRGGSPSGADSCIIYNPDEVTLIQTGQIRYSTKITVNIKVDFLPKQLLQSIDCNDRCSSVIVAKVLSSSYDYQSITSQYIPGSVYSFSMQIQFGKPYIPKFELQVRINPVLSKYFKNTRIDKALRVEVNPAYLAETEGKDRLS